MERESVRLECLKLAYAHHVHADEVVVKAGILENYVLGNTQGAAKSVDESKAKKHAIRIKGSDNADILS